MLGGPTAYQPAAPTPFSLPPVAHVAAFQAKGLSKFADNSLADPQPVQADAFHRRPVLSPRRAFALWTLGALGGGGLSHGLAKAFLNNRAQSLPKAVPSAAQVASHPEAKQSLLLLFSRPLETLFMRSFQVPEVRTVLGLYLGLSALGVAATQVLDGVQQTWVRRQETALRAGLLGQLTQVFQTSLSKKEAMDDALRQTARTQVSQLLRPFGPQLDETAPGLQLKGLSRSDTLPTFVNLSFPSADSPDLLRRLAVEPTHRATALPLSLALTFGKQAIESQRASTANAPLPFLHAIDAFSIGAGVLCGSLVGGIAHFWQGKLHGGVTPTTTTKALTQADFPALIEVARHAKNPWMLGAYGLLVGTTMAARMGLAALKEVEVTRVHAQTEYDFQAYNWTQLDPAFHQTAEQQALHTSLQHLQRQLPQLAKAPALLQQTLTTLYTNIGRQSAPKYYLMTPPVALVEARS